MKCKTDRLSEQRPDRTRRMSRAVWIGVALSMLSTVSTASAQTARPSMSAIEQAVLDADAATGSLKQNWEPVVRLLEDVTVQTPDPVLRMIKGHACLATNHNNKSVCLFLSVQVPEDQKQWLQWAEDFANRNSNAPIAHYFKGDALARLGKWKDAITCFTSAVDHAPNKHHALALNARGAAKAQVGDYEVAFDDLLKASQQATDFSDAHANLGALSIAQREGATSALKDFTKAIRLARKSGHEFAVALYGRSCIEAVLGQDEQAEKDRNQALATAACARSTLMAAYQADLDLLIATSGRDRDVGKAGLAKFGIQSKVIDALNNPFHMKSTRIRQLRQAWELAQSDPQLRAEFKSTLNSTITHNRLGPGVAKNLTGILGGAGINTALTGIDRGQTMETTSNSSASVGVVGDIPHGRFRSSIGQMQRLTEQKHYEPANPGLGNIPKVKGFATVPERVVWDSDACPFTPVYALFYRLPLSGPATRPAESIAVSAGRQGTVSTPMGSQTGEAE